MVLFGYEQVLRFATFQDNIQAWKRKASGDKTWIKFKEFMVEEYNDYLEDMVIGEANPHRQASLLYTNETLTTLTGVTENPTTDKQTLIKMGVANLTIKRECGPQKTGPKANRKSQYSFSEIRGAGKTSLSLRRQENYYKAYI